MIAVKTIGVMLVVSIAVKLIRDNLKKENMGYAKQLEKGKTKKKGFNLNDLNDVTNPKTQNMVFGLLAKHKKTVVFVLFLLVLSIINHILTFLMAFKLI